MSYSARHAIAEGMEDFNELLREEQIKAELDKLQFEADRAWDLADLAQERYGWLGSAEERERADEAFEDYHRALYAADVVYP